MSISPRRRYPNVEPSDVLTFSKPTRDFLCPLSANTHQIEFLEFTISDYASKNILFMVGRDYPPPVDVDLDLGSLDENAYRLIKYEFSEDVLRLPSIQTSLVFSVGNQAVSNFRMVERHYFRDQLVKSFDFTFGFCIPSSTNTWDAVYDVPPLRHDLIEDMIANPYETKSDSFYFVEDRLIMHNKASYKYLPEDTAQAKKSYEDRYAGTKRSMKQVSKYDSDDDRFHEETRRMDREALTCDEQKVGGRYDKDDEEDEDAARGGNGRGDEGQSWSKEWDDCFDFD